MSTALVAQPRNSSARALEKVSKKLNDLSNPGALIKAVLPNFTGLNLIGLPFQKTAPNIVRVVLDNKTASPGDTIRGIVKLMISEPVPVENLTIQLYGRSKTYAGLYNAVRGRIPFESFFTLVDQTIDVEVEPKVLTPKVYEFPFEIPVPATVTIAEADWPFDENTKRFNSNFTQPLPATFEAFSTAHAHVDCSIKYLVIAKLTSKQEKQDIQHKAPLIIKTNDARALMASNSVNTCYMTCPFKFRMTSSGAAGPLFLQPGKGTPGSSMTSMLTQSETEVVAGPSTSKRSKLKDLAKDNLLRFRLPAYAFDLFAEIPRSGRMSEALPIVLRLTWHPPKSNQPIDRPPPATTLTSMKVSLQSRFMVRGTTQDNYNDVSLAVVEQKATWHCVWRSEHITISELKDAIELGPETEAGKLMFVHPHKFRTAFKTFSIGREYVLTVICNLTCAGESFQAKYEVDGFNILAEGDGDVDDFDAGRPKRVRRPAAYYDGDSDVEDEEAGGEGESESVKSEDTDRQPKVEDEADIGIEDELFKKDGLKTASHRVNVKELLDEE